MKKPIIGVLPLVDDERESLWMLPGYMDGISSAGGLPIMLPLTSDAKDIREIAHICDGFLFTGGHDVSPEVYGEKTLFYNVAPCARRDAMEKILLEAAIALDTPVLGICRGIQVINALLGGTLYQDLPSQRPTPVEHHQSPPYSVPAHSVTILKNTPLYDIIGAEKLFVNSYHHQAIKTLSPRLSPAAVSEDGLTEGVYMPGKRFLLAVQWHPEFAFETDENARKIFAAFVNSAK